MKVKLSKKLHQIRKMLINNNKMIKSQNFKSLSKYLN